MRGGEFTSGKSQRTVRVKRSEKIDELLSITKKNIGDGLRFSWIGHEDLHERQS